MKIPLTFANENRSFLTHFLELPVQGMGGTIIRSDGRMGCQNFRSLRKVFELLLCRRKRRNNQEKVQI